MGKSKGFTIIEFLVVIAIFIVLSTVIISILVTVLRGSSKSDSIIVVRQNGSHAMEQIIKQMRYAKSLDYPSVVGGTSPVCSTAGLVVDTIRITNVDLTQSIFECPSSFSAPNFISMDSVELTNSNTTVVTACNFVCVQPASGPPTINISFTLSKINANGLPEGNTVIPFQSSVTLRNVSGG